MSEVVVHDSLSHAAANAASPQAPGAADTASPETAGAVTPEESLSAPETAEESTGGTGGPEAGSRPSPGDRAPAKTVRTRKQSAGPKAGSGK